MPLSEDRMPLFEDRMPLSEEQTRIRRQHGFAAGLSETAVGIHQEKEQGAWKLWSSTYIFPFV